MVKELIMKLKMQDLINKVIEIQYNAVNMYEAYLNKKKEYYMQQEKVKKGALIWEILNGDGSQSDYYKKTSVTGQTEKINEIKAEIDEFENKYLKTEDKRLYIKGLISADMEMLYKSYRLGNMDAAFMWGLVTLLGGKYEIPDSLKHMKPSYVKKSLELENIIIHDDDPLQIMEKVASQNTTYSSDAILVLAEYYEAYGLTEAKDLDDAEINLKKSFEYYEKLREHDHDTYKKYKDRIKNIKSVLECYDLKKNPKDAVKNMTKITKRKEGMAKALFALMAVPFAIVLLFGFITVFKHGVELEVDQKKPEMIINLPGDTVVVGKHFLSFSEKYAFFRGDSVPYIIPIDIYTINGDEYVPKKYVVRDGVTKISCIGDLDKITQVNLPDSVIE